MWKTLGGFSAEISRFAHILPAIIGQIHCSAGLVSFLRRPYFGWSWIKVSLQVNHCVLRWIFLAEFRLNWDVFIL
jgi:hypothetical protein